LAITISMRTEQEKTRKLAAQEQPRLRPRELAAKRKTKPARASRTQS